MAPTAKKSVRAVVWAAVPFRCNTLSRPAQSKFRICGSINVICLCLADDGVHTLQSKKSQEGINTRLALVMKSGKFTLGTKTCLKCLRSGKGMRDFTPVLPLCLRRVLRREPMQIAWTSLPSCCQWQLLRSTCLLAAKLVIISNNTPPIKKSEIEYYAMLSKTGVHHYTGSEHVSRYQQPLL